MSPGILTSRNFWLSVVVLVTFFLFLQSNRPAQSMRYGKSVLQNRYGLGAGDNIQDIRNATLGFQKIFVINLRSRSDRRDIMALAAHFTGLDVEFIDGVTEIDDKALPLHDPEFNPSRGFFLSWRAHMNAARTIVERNITSALILEDDSDWDVRIKSQMQTFASASRLLLQPRVPTSSEHEFWDVSNPRVSENESHHDYYPDQRIRTLTPTSSPYGDIDRWDMLWLGHCATRFPRPEDMPIPLGRAILTDDATVPEPQHIAIQFGNDDLVKEYPPHTRVVHRVAGNACPLAYALSLPGARRMLYELSSNMTEVLDFELARLCEGYQGRRMRTCLTVQPQLFQQHRPVGPKSAQSDISDHMGEYRETPFSRNIRLSTRVNLRKLVDGDPEAEFVDTFPDGAEAADLGF